MAELKLGQPVTITDYLVRAEMSGYQATVIVDMWSDFPEKIADQARSGLNEYVRRTGHHPRSWSSYGWYKVWIPASVFYKVRAEDRAYLREDSRRHPTPHRDSIALPVEGIIVQQTQVQDGMPVREDYGSDWHSMSSRVGFLVAYHLSRRPLLVLPSMIEEGP